MLFSLHSLVLLGLSFLSFAQEAPPTSSTVAPPSSIPPTSAPVIAGNALSRRAEGDSPDGFLDGQVSWTSWTSGDGQKTGKDADGVPYIQELIKLILQQTPDAIGRNMVFWAGGQTTDQKEDVGEFQESETRMPNGGHQFTDLFGQSLFDQLKIEFASPQYWRAINRMSKALGASTTNGDAYVFLNPACGRTIFSPPSQNPSDHDESADGGPTNGEIWYYAELPALMRNTNINKIYSFWKVNGRRFTVKEEWDASNPGEHPRTWANDIEMDVAPIVLPSEAGRDPMKRSIGQHGVW